MGCQFSKNRRKIRALKLTIEELEKENDELKKRIYFDIESLVLGYQHIALQIFDELDEKTLGNCRLVNRAWKKCIDNGKTFWTRLCHRFEHLPILETYYLIPRKHTLVDTFPDVRVVFDFIKTRANVPELRMLIDLFQELSTRFANQGPHRYTDDHPLHYAASRHRWDILELLLKAGIDANTPNHCGNTIFEEYQLEGFQSKYLNAAPTVKKLEYAHVMPPDQFLMIFSLNELS